MPDIFFRDIMANAFIDGYFSVLNIIETGEKVWNVKMQQVLSIQRVLIYYGDITNLLEVYK